MITDIFLINLAKAMNGETDTVTSHMGISSTTQTPQGTDTSILGEYSPRVTTAGTRESTASEVTFVGIRSGAIASSTGDYVNHIALFDGATSTALLFAEGIVPNIQHTQSFDLEVNWTISIERK